MGIFSSIWNKITGHKPKAAPVPPPASTAGIPAPNAARSLSTASTSTGGRAGVGAGAAPGAGWALGAGVG